MKILFLGINKMCVNTMFGNSFNEVISEFPKKDTVG